MKEQVLKETVQRGHLTITRAFTEAQKKESASFSDSEIPSVKKRLRQIKGRPVVGLGREKTGLKFGQKVKYNGKNYLLYDSDAMADAPKGLTLLLVSPDLKTYVRYVQVDELS